MPKETVLTTVTGKPLKLHLAKCPITLGMPTSMTQEGFDLCCARHTRDRKVQRGCNYKQLESTLFDKYCELCKGTLPKEVTIITIPR
jgi:hypothetical protein